MKLSLKLTNKNPGPESSPLPDGTQILLLEKKARNLRCMYECQIFKNVGI